MKSEIKYGILIGLVGSFFIVELGVGIYAKSLSLQSDAFHMLSDLIALIIGLTCDILSKEKRRTNYTYGWIRAEIIGGLINSVFLLALSFSILISLIEKTIELSTTGLENPKLMEEIDTVLIVAGLGLAINLIGLILFHEHHHHPQKVPKSIEDDNQPRMNEQITIDISPNSPNLLNYSQNPVPNPAPNPDSNPDPHPNSNNHNHHGVWLHVLGDALGSVVVIISGLMIKYIESPYRFIMDPIASLLIMVAIAWHSWKLLQSTIFILIHKNPYDEDKIITEIKRIDGIEDIHEFHIWSLTTSINIASIHVKLCHDCWDSMTDEVIRQINVIFHKNGIHSSTIQPEFTGSCIEFLCKTNCKPLQCC
ncbi:MAG: cation diffusion facilitator family transporter [Candidatus Paceibacterota bacterium]